MKIELLCVGTELLNGRVNTHQSVISLRLRELGHTLSRESSLPDDVKVIRSAVKESLRRSDILILCGGLGPTFDDITREAVASALKRRLVYRPELFKTIARKFARYRIPVPEENKRQAEVITGAEVLKNTLGSAPGQWLLQHRRGKKQAVILLPGPAREMVPMLEGSVIPRLRRLFSPRQHAASAVLHLSGLSESLADEKLSGVLARAGEGVEFTILSSIGMVDFYARAVGLDASKARSLLASVRRQAYAAVGPYIYGEGTDTLESVLARLLKKRGLTLAIAESCTAGMLGQRLTRVPGSSAAFKGGVIAYSDHLKKHLLGVRAETLRRHGAVSDRCALEMAAGAKRAAGADVGLSITGIAGPGGGSKEKPVGLVYVALEGPGRFRRSWRLRLPGDRDAIRERTVVTAMNILWKTLGSGLKT